MRQKGFTLLEILVVIALFAVVYSLIPGNLSGSTRDQLQEGIDKITRSIRFAQNESVLRNCILRLNIKISGTEEQTYSIDYAPSDTLPLPELKNSNRLSLRELEEQKQIMANIDRQFQPVPEMEDEDLKFPSGILVQGVGLSTRNFIQTEDEYSLYFYPTGEKDSVIFFLSSIEEIATISVGAFTEEPDVEYHYLEEDDIDLVEREIKALYETWRQN